MMTFDLLMHARFVSYEERENCEFVDVEYFIDHYQQVLSFNDVDMDQIFVEYQLLEQNDVPQHVWQSAKEKSEDEESTFICMDVVWGFLSSASTGDGCRIKSAHLSKFARLVLVLPHSNAGDEWIISMVRLKKMPYRSSLNLDGTLSSILTVGSTILNLATNLNHQQICMKNLKRQHGNTIKNTLRRNDSTETFNNNNFFYLKKR